MQIERIEIDPSVSTVFPQTVLREKLETSPIDVTLLDESVEDVDNCDAVVTFDHREAFFDLQWVHSIQAGVDKFPLDEFEREGIVLTNSSGIHGDAIGETVAGYVLAFARRLHAHIASQQESEWSQPDWDEAWTIAGEQACVIGLGGLGRGIVDRLSGLDLEISGLRRTPTPEPGVEQVYTPREINHAVEDARFVVAAVPLTEETRGMIDSETFASMRDDAYLINVARGPVVDQSDLVQALDSAEIAGAALDVFETEPLPESSPLWEMDNVIVTPHCGAFTREYCVHIATIVRESITRIQTGGDPVNRVV